ncbi:lytic polysaccharide monooxygenase [Trichoderma citrinoviride]|uniref:lytic cellulose monooxygenase (C4-dehydrogenating) n=1 Tax=Trichoderma citrinoviride TaxID=58853 RepID=A0A2T4BM82_9HYPO|nr:lytic polysaccharide monooxygenase [Trichoderma citrinoviride]PTB70380.1 lytic polysaccharide monooxygenase [Trichoderma citrinoviride]
MKGFLFWVGLLLLGLACTASAHTTFTTLFIDKKNQGDGTCVRMPYDDKTATNPVKPITSSDMACGRNGGDPVSFICPAKKGSLLTFEFRLWPDAQEPGSIDPGHLGPCAVYVKKVDDMFSDSAAGGGWFKIWEDGYDPKTQKWCVDRLVKNNGLLSVRLPRGLPAGYYIVRPEILALHWAAHRNDPQFYLGCAQIFLNSDVRGPLEVPRKQQVSIPGYVSAKTPGLTLDIYQDEMPPYPMPGPKVYIPTVKKSDQDSNVAPLVQKDGLIPKDCLIKKANWCGKPVEPYSTSRMCWRAVNDCYAQSKKCRESSPPIGLTNCDRWSNYCGKMDALCEKEKFKGPPKFTEKEYVVPAPGRLPEVWNDIFEKLEA